MFFEMLSYVDPAISKQKVFLILGGIANNLYVSQSKYPLLGLSGFARIHYPDILRALGIEHTKLDLKQFLELYRRDAVLSDTNFFIVPFNNTMLKEQTFENVNLNVLGDSQGLVKNFEFKEKKINLAINDYWIDLDVFSFVEEKSKDILANPICIYMINKSKLVESSKLSELITKSYSNLLRENLVNYSAEGYETIQKKSIRIYGSSSFHYQIKFFSRLKKRYLTCGNRLEKEKIAGYINIVISEYRKFLITGSDANYRNEFLDVMKLLFYRKENNQFQECIDYWQTIVLDWTKLVMELTKTSAYKNITEKSLANLDYMIDFIEEIWEKESKGIVLLDSLLSN